MKPLLTFMIAIFSLLTFSIVFVNADFGYNNLGVPQLPPEINYSKLIQNLSINSSDYWDDLNSPADILTSTLNNDAFMELDQSNWFDDPYGWWYYDEITYTANFNESKLSTNYLNLSGTNADRNINIGSNDFTTTGKGTFGDLRVNTSNNYLEIDELSIFFGSYDAVYLTHGGSAFDGIVAKDYLGVNADSGTDAYFSIGNQETSTLTDLAIFTYETDTGILKISNSGALFSFENSPVQIKESSTTDGAYIKIWNSDVSSGTATAELEFRHAGGSGYKGGKIVSVRKSGGITSSANADIAMDFYTTLNNVNYLALEIDENQDLFIPNDNAKLYFGNHSNSSISYDGTNLVFITNESGGQGIAWFSNNISAQGYLTRTSVYDKSRGSALDFVRDSEDYINYLTGEIDHSEFYGYTTYEVTDYSRPVEYEVPIINCSLNKTSGEECFEEIIIDIKYPYKKIEEGVSLDKEIDVLRQATYELKVQNQQLESRIQTLEETCVLK